MARRASGWWLLLWAAAACWWCGCSPNALLPPDERRDANVLKARRAQKLGDYAEAAQHFQRALETNPAAAQTHLAYAILCDQRLERCAEAAYHYGRYLQLRPDEPRAEEIRRRITNCTERLAMSVPLIVRSESIARELERVRRENDYLKTELQRLNGVLVGKSNEIHQLQMALHPAQSSDAPPDMAASQHPGSAPTPSQTPSAARARRPAPGEERAGAATRIHVVRKGESIAQIARRYGLGAQAILRVNPGVEPRRLQPGQRLLLPEA